MLPLDRRYNPKCMRNETLTILEPDGKIAKGQKAPSLNKNQLLETYRLMLLSRRVDERMTMLQRQGRIGFYIGSIGEEAAILGSAMALKEEDWVIPCYRELGAALLRKFPLYDFFCQLFGNAEDSNLGRQMPNHYSFRPGHLTSISSPVGSQIPQAAGMGMAAKIRGTKEVFLVYFGDGATSQGDFHVGANFAGVFKAPVVFLCRNNQWAISVPRERQTAAESYAIKAAAYGFPGLRVDGNDPLAVYSVTRQAVDRARQGKGPTLIEAVTYRQGAHSTSDDPRAYRDSSEVEEWKKKDPLRRMKLYLASKKYWSEQKDAKLEEEIKAQIQEALKAAEKVGPPPVETLFEGVFDRIPWHLKEQQAAYLEFAREHNSVHHEA